MSLQKLFLPLSIFAAVVTVYLLFRGQGNVPSQVVTPNPASSGVPATYNFGSVTPATYNVPVIPGAAALTPTALSSNPQSATPVGGGPSQVPAYLTFNFGPGSDLTKNNAVQASPVSDSSCGCSSSKQKNSCVSCKSSNSYTDGNSPTPMASSKAAAIDNTPADALKQQWKNVMNYLASSDPTAIPSLTSQPQSADLGGNPTNGTAWFNDQGVLSPYVQ